MGNRKGVDTDERGGRQKRGGVEEEETITRIYYVRKILVSIIGKVKRNNTEVSVAGEKEFRCNLTKTKVTTCTFSKIIHFDFKILFLIKDCVWKNFTALVKKSL